MADKSDTKLTTLGVSITLPAPSKDQKQPSVRAYLFDAAQRLVQSQPAKDKLEFQIDPSQSYRVTVGPDLIQPQQAAPAGLVTRLAASSAISADYMPHIPVQSLSFAILEQTALNWLSICINIHGSVRKLLNPGSSPAQYAPLCTGVVQIFTIDLACSLARLSDPDLLNVRNQTLARMLNVEIADLESLNFADFARVSALAAGMFALTGNALRNYIVANRAALSPFMCELIPEWAICYQQLPDAAIQSDGTFSENYCFPFWQVPPDVYFEVVQTIDGVTQEVADPDILCTTMWGYDGSQPAVITVTDPAAIACQPNPYPGPGYLYVWPTAIGNVDLGGISGLETLAGTGLLPGNTPWGGTLPLQVQFDPNLRANDIRYYRWSYKFPGDPDYTQINASVTHRWQEVTFPGGGVIDIHLHPVTLGPQLVGAETNLFEIPDPLLPWIDINDPVDRPFAYFDSTAGETPGRSGLVTLRLEMFNHLGNHVVCGNAGHGGPFQFLLPDLGAPVGNYTNAPAPNIDASGNLIYQVLVDNNPTTARLDGTRTGSHGSADACGILHTTGGGDPVTIQYAATHPHNYLDWSLTVSRGTAGVVASTGGSTSSPDPAFFVNSASALLGSCPQAAFAVNLYTAARAVNGYSRQSQYDRSATIAFALLNP